MKILIIFILLTNILLLIYNFVIFKNNSKDKNKYKDIIKTQKIEIEFLKNELEEIEDGELFEGGVSDM